MDLFRLRRSGPSLKCYYLVKTSRGYHCLALDRLSKDLVRNEARRYADVEFPSTAGDPSRMTISAAEHMLMQVSYILDQSQANPHSLPQQAQGSAEY